ncbi:hypothetical protein N7488_006333, partial [Penicillium malachiteum]
MKGSRLSLLLGSLLAIPHAAALSNDTLQVYAPSTLKGVTASDTCVDALLANVTCYVSLGAAVTQYTTWTSGSLSLICSEDCQQSLEDYVTDVDAACGTDTLYNISGSMQTASLAGREMQWKQTATCLKDPSSGELCNLLFHEAAQNGTGSTLSCSNCTLEYLTSLANSQWGQQMLEPAMVESRIASCSATAYYSVTYTATTTATTVATSTATATNIRCNKTDTDQVLYTVQTNETCINISAAQNVSTPALEEINALDAACQYLTENQILCLPPSCSIYKVGANDTCSSIVATLSREVSTTIFRSWNPSINIDCSNLNSLIGEYLCVSPPGSMEIPISFPLASATTAVPVPTNAVTTSNTDCGFWYTIQSGETCETVEEKFGVSTEDFYFLNPQLNKTCNDLWAGNSYCVEAVGNIVTYSGYPTTTRSLFTTLGSTIDLSLTVTANHSTTHFFYSYPPVSTQTVSYNSSAYCTTQNYTLCNQALEYYNITSSEEITDEVYANPTWYAEYERVCALDLSEPLPTIPFNTSIPLTTTSASIRTTITAKSTSTLAKAGAKSTSVPTSPTTTTTNTPSATATSNISPNGLCGSSNSDWTCAGSQFGDCCSEYGYCGSSSDYCSFGNCDTDYGNCNITISSDGLCGSTNGDWVCKGSQFGDCCSQYGYCGSTSDYCAVANCD